MKRVGGVAFKSVCVSVGRGEAANEVNIKVESNGEKVESTRCLFLLSAHRSHLRDNVPVPAREHEGGHPAHSQRAEGLLPAILEPQTGGQIPIGDGGREGDQKSYTYTHTYTCRHKEKIHTRAHAHIRTHTAQTFTDTLVRTPCTYLVAGATLAMCS